MKKYFLQCLLITLFMASLLLALEAQVPEIPKDQNFDEWSNSIQNPGSPKVNPIPLNHDVTSKINNSTPSVKKLNKDLLEKALATSNSTEYAYKTADLTSGHNPTFKGVDNEKLYAGNKTQIINIYIIIGIILLAATALFLLNKKHTPSQISENSSVDKSTPENINPQINKEIGITETINALKDLESLLQNGSINREEFENMKSKLF